MNGVGSVERAVISKQCAKDDVLLTNICDCVQTIALGKSCTFLNKTTNVTEMTFFFNTLASDLLEERIQCTQEIPILCVQGDMETPHTQTWKLFTLSHTHASNSIVCFLSSCPGDSIKSVETNEIC
mmetsp:Transcript_48016/g.56099  ORF Transcript_48016/g.56099 Transcript_48016/m.56099 type:complete len:126 (-) Transcript_48016:1035-1412(-)